MPRRSLFWCALFGRSANIPKHLMCATDSPTPPALRQTPIHLALWLCVVFPYRCASGVETKRGSVALAAQSALNGGAVFAGPPPSAGALSAAHDALLRDPSLQFSFGKAAVPPVTHLPPWLEAVFKAIAVVLKAIAPFLGWIFIGGLVLALLLVLFFLGREFARTRWPELFKRKTSPPKPEPWRPEAAVARALLDEADKLAAAGRYAEAVRLILHRSIEEIEGRRPRTWRPGSWASHLPGKAQAQRRRESTKRAR